MTTSYWDTLIQTSVPNMAIILGNLSMVLGGYHGGLDLANAFFSISLGIESLQICILQSANSIC